MNVLLLPLIAGYFLNGGVGTLIQPSATSSGSGPPPGHTVIVTQAGASLVTQAGAKLITG